MFDDPRSGQQLLYMSRIPIFFQELLIFFTLNVRVKS